MTRSSELDLLPARHLVQTSEVDHADWNYRAALGWIQRLRFRMVVDLLRGAHYGRLLEIGYGSGILMPELGKYADELYGIDPHPMAQEVAAQLAQVGVQAQLHSGSAERTPFEDDYFDVAVTVSALEYVPDIDLACAEIRRILRPGGKLIVVTPGDGWLLDTGLKLLTREDANENYGDRRQRLAPTLRAAFGTEQVIRRPWLSAWIVPLYKGFRLVNDR